MPGGGSGSASQGATRHCPGSKQAGSAVHDQGCLPGLEAESQPGERKAKKADHIRMLLSPPVAMETTPMIPQA